MLRIILAVLVPWLNFFTIGRPIAGIICLILQISLIGWLPAVVWSLYALMKFNNAKNLKELMNS